MRHVIPVSGKDSCATAVLQIAREPGLPYELFFNDVGAELPETYAWLDKVEAKVGRPVVRVGKSLEKVIFDQGILPSHDRRFCTRLGKIKPMEDWLGGDEATVYFGIRADEDRVGFVPTRYNIRPLYPLKELGVGLPLVYAVLGKLDLLPPKFFWQSMYDEVLGRLERRWQQGFKMTKPPTEVLAGLPAWYFDELFAWRTRSNCYFCFFQRLYEWVGLLEHHPRLFDRAEAIENKIIAGNTEAEKQFTWVAGYPLSRIRAEADRIKRKRVAQVLRVLRTRHVKGDATDLLAVTSCGLFCGK